jgi:hypothetical protein
LILSFFGTSKNRDVPHHALAIEVKGQAVAGAREFKFFLTSHEWATAVALGDQYLIRLWDGVRPGHMAAATRTEPLLLFPESLAGHVPRRPARGGVCDWNSALIKLSAEGKDIRLNNITRQLEFARSLIALSGTIERDQKTTAHKNMYAASAMGGPTHTGRLWYCPFCLPLANEMKRLYSFVRKFLTKRWFCDVDINQT